MDKQKKALYDREYRRKNRAKRAAYAKAYYHSHLSEWHEQVKHYRETHRQRIAEHGKTYRNKLRISVIQRLGGKCIRCGFNDWRALQIDHVQGGGTRERRVTNRQDTVYHHYLLKLPDEELFAQYQILCANCNWIKRYENYEHTAQHVIPDEPSKRITEFCAVSVLP